MTSAQIQDVEEKLIAFIDRATKESATAEEIAALPQVAFSLVEISRI